jgi:hypothetical protein
MRATPVWQTVSLCGVFLLTCSHVWGLMTIERIAEQGAPVSKEMPKTANWPVAVLEFVNNPLRTIGWETWWHGHPNDVKRFSFKITKPADMQHIINAFANIKSDKLSIVLASGNGPIDPFRIDGTRLSGVEFAIGDQKAIDAWCSSPLRDWGDRSEDEIRKLKQLHVATPPTLVIYLDNELITLESLKIPLHVSLGVRSRWHWNKHTEKWELPAQTIVDFVKEHSDKQKQTKKSP